MTIAWLIVFVFVCCVFVALSVYRYRLESALDENMGKQSSEPLKFSDSKFMGQFADWIWLYFEVAFETFLRVGYKMYMYGYSTMFMLLANEQKRPKSLPANRLKYGEAEVVGRKTIILFRHGESVWNYVFNRGINIGVLFRLAYALCWESFLWSSLDSVLIDTPLCANGVTQAVQVQRFLAWGVDPKESAKDGSVAVPVKENGLVDVAKPVTQHVLGAPPPVPAVTEPDSESVSETLAMLRGDGHWGGSRSILVCSNLRRAISTVLIGFSERLQRNPGEQVYIHSALQELTRNVDGNSITPSRSVPRASLHDNAIYEGMRNKIEPRLSSLYEKRLDADYNAGTKPLHSSVWTRQKEFADWVFESYPGHNTSCVIVGGHSAWFRYFFKSWLPSDSKHIALNTKLVNCGLVRLTLCKLQSGRQVDYHILPESVEVILGGFDKKSALRIC